MKFAFRADASFSMGAGHVSRCLTLASTLLGMGHEVMFISREFDGNMNNRLRDLGISTCGLPLSADGQAVPSPSLGASVATDALQTREAIADFGADWLIADHYGIDMQWLQSMRKSIRRLMVIDDLANRQLDCDVLLDQNLFFAGDARYRHLVPDYCQLLIGPNYALINEEYAKRRQNPLRKRVSLDRILLFFGGGKTAAALIQALGVLSEPEFANIAIDLVANPQMADFASVKAVAEARPGTTLHPPLPHLADLTMAADLAIGGGGANTWERMCLGLPSIVVVMAENQRPLAAELAQRGLTSNLGDLDTLDANNLREALRRVTFPGVLADTSKRLQAFCDGQGAHRVAERLVHSS